MIKRSIINSTNISTAVSVILKSAKKRRSMAFAAAKAINSDIGINNKLIAIK